MVRFPKYFIYLFFSLVPVLAVTAQEKKPGYDSSYVERASKKMLFRLYTSQKYTDLVVNVPGGIEVIAISLIQD
ncbi:hypothetical protein V8V91_20365 [Algoriphagus halophilus]|uniref:hypothetical protein n=1 Tax=Algoriphagus halophilus TaxID=226505 RepID=UPI00358FF976